ncbi:DNA repair protein RadA [Leucobacter sp. OLJS4]|uniref:DNA repair protein RadA n=1 Tax=unclassified Leucobacter TaxID=2621730 RepID=UPI000C19CA8B|nr:MULTISPECIES: DNA repair protein RadA [unclassified Leucobacter]PIJ52545.1 DNA repair protein RadA [Leucobacter sp. OLES1]PII83690.1 DNA repair protein RadA [Leucobacter sp. OLCALW19]PII87048.1 DNA repair protein RadA [Leucobacter sp. OLTLW20]PII89484.1 DNA repair protein RadA [Leucobacter sp. OLAS13]PII97943.1 DNA repair protein RadA [Leucobacter sp. OLDS2]
MAKSSGGYACTECGWRAPKWVGRCGECQQWGTVQVLGAPGATLARTVQAAAPVSGREARPITELSGEPVRHRPTGIGELDRVLGGGIVPGAAVLFSGEPGVGKSTLLLDAAARTAERGGRVLYASGEESTGQIRMRAERTGALHDTLYLASETDLATVLGHIEAVQPELVIVDSVQTLASDRVDGGAGGPAQVREVAAALIRVAKEHGVPVILVGHVTKDGNVAGPRLLEHLVDVVCHFEGDRRSTLRFLRTLKNRFGPTDEVGCFEMSGSGIQEVPDPSGLFLSRSTEPVSGTCATIALEGRRAIPVEVQALVASTTAPNPRRVTSGVDGARVAMVLAVLERRARVKLHDKDVYVSTVGGVRLAEPAADLAIALAVLSAITDRPLAHELAAVGEISLAGEVRPVVGGEQRRAEAQRLGYRRLVDSDSGTLARARALALGE